jgi:hypothetical protein
MTTRSHRRTVASTRRPTAVDERELAPAFVVAELAVACGTSEYQSGQLVEGAWATDPLFYPARPPAHWPMCAEVSGRVLVVPLAHPATATHAATFSG